jgi:hypothetical protein
MIPDFRKFTIVNDAVQKVRLIPLPHSGFGILEESSAAVRDMQAGENRLQSFTSHVNLQHPVISIDDIATSKDG